MEKNNVNLATESEDRKQKTEHICPLIETAQQTDFVYDHDSEAYQAMIKEVSGRC